MDLLLLLFLAFIWYALSHNWNIFYLWRSLEIINIQFDLILGISTKNEGSPPLHQTWHLHHPLWTGTFFERDFGKDNLGEGGGQKLYVWSIRWHFRAINFNVRLSLSLSLNLIYPLWALLIWWSMILVSPTLFKFLFNS